MLPKAMDFRARKGSRAPACFVLGSGRRGLKASQAGVFKVLLENLAVAKSMQTYLLRCRVYEVATSFPLQSHLLESPYRREINNEINNVRPFSSNCFCNMRGTECFRLFGHLNSDDYSIRAEIFSTEVRTVTFGISLPIKASGTNFPVVHK